jgi:hypothetical protein
LLNEEDKNIEPFDKKSLENAIKKYGFINLVGERV